MVPMKAQNVETVPDKLPNFHCHFILRQLSGYCVLGVVWEMCLNTVFLFVLDLGFGRHVVPHPPSIRTHNTLSLIHI